MDSNQVRNIASNLMFKLDIHCVYRETMEKLVDQHCLKQNCIYRCICNIVKGSKIVDKTRNWYTVHWNQRLCERLMKKISKTTLINVQKR